MRTLLSLLALTAALSAGPVRAQQSVGNLPPLPPPPTLPPPPGEPQAPVVQPPAGGEEPGTQPAPPAAVEPARPEGVGMVDGHPRQGPFLAGPGSLAFVLDHTLLGAGAGLTLTGIPNRFDLSSRQARISMLVGTLLGAGAGFSASAWYQFNNWMDRPVASLAVANTVIGGMLGAGVANLLSDDAMAVATAAVVGAELGSWLTVTVGGGELPRSTALLVGSGGAWGLAYGTLLFATLHFSGTRFEHFSSVVPPLLLAPAIGAGAMALAATRYQPTSTQVMRANVFGAAVGGGVLLLSGLVAGSFTVPIPYILAMLSSAGAMTAVSLLWEESAERPVSSLQYGKRKDRPYRTWWW